ncbi:MAG: glycoside hydrolase family 127 protein [Lachnospiraceae bacterium]|nr:glycoside hydrolase family 127 protein [Lachnospiraceae bacterium]
MDGISKPLDLHKVKVADGFWKDEMELVRNEILPYQWNALNDNVEGAAPSFCMRNFKEAVKLNKKRKTDKDFKEPVFKPGDFETLPKKEGELEEFKFYGFVFQDTDFYKWVEAVGYSLIAHPDEELEKLADGAIDIVSEAQQENGYLDTYYILNGQDAVFTNLRDNHELYCLGHLIEGAVSYYESTGKDKLLKVACRYADFVDEKFGKGKIEGYPGHEIAEMALIKLFEVTKEDRYKKLAKYFIDQRGQKPYYFEANEEHDTPLNPKYHQMHKPVREQEEPVGHAVRAVYLYSGMADVARVYNDEELFECCDTLWKNIVEKKMYVTGGIGATHIGEAFSFNYDLPNDTAYNETCAAIGLVFFTRRMLEMKADSKYADIMELALYNGVLSGMALDGKSFFYVNPLEVLPKACHEDDRKFHVKPVRQKWFGCACCPPNLARLLSSIGAYAFTENKDVFYVHQYIGTDIEASNGIKAKLESGFPWEGSANIRITETKEKEDFTFALRLPAWDEGGNIRVYDKTKNDITSTLKKEEKDGYLYITKSWEAGDVISAEFVMNVSILEADSRIREDIGKVAIKRGPVVYCLEEKDNGADLHMLSVDVYATPAVKDDDILGTKIKSIDIAGVRRKPNLVDTGMPYKMVKNVEFEETSLHFIPYYTWANRGENEMRVWI